MKKLILSIMVAFAAIAMQAQDLPKPSPHGESKFVVGVTEIALDYSRPGVKDRTIFGDLLAYGKVWRFGANASTKFKTSHDLQFGDETLKAGEYAVLAIPGEESWQIIFSNDLGVSEQTYLQENDALRVNAKPQKHSFTETLTIGVNEVRSGSATFEMVWENTKVSVPFTVNTDKYAVENIETAIAAGEDLGSVYESAAGYYYGLKEYKTALDYVNQSVDLGDSYRNLFLKARILKELGKEKDAVALAEKALDLANENASMGYINFISGTLESWKK